MIQDDAVRTLMQIATPKKFQASQYICYEGQPGNEMYIILKGSVGVFVSNAVGKQTEVSRIMAGDFFGEMAIFDNLPRSASCIALEDVVCVAIDKSRLTKFITACPDMTINLLENMSGRIRKLNGIVYKNEKFNAEKTVPPFSIPELYSFSHIVEEPYHDLNYTEAITAQCPICGKSITVLNLKKQIMSVSRFFNDGRLKYKECEPLWYDVWSCPYCHYSNYYTGFFQTPQFTKDVIRKVLTEQHIPVLGKATNLTTPFDHLFLRYIQAIHINESVNCGDVLLIGKLWLGLYWLFDDAADESMKMYCAKKAAEFLFQAVNEQKIPDAYSRQSIALTLANLFVAIGQKDNAQKMCMIVLNGEDKQLKNFAYTLKDSL